MGHKNFSAGTVEIFSKVLISKCDRWTDGKSVVFTQMHSRPRTTNFICTKATTKSYIM